MSDHSTRVLIVDDDLATRELVAAVLRKQDPEIVCVAAEGADAAVAEVERGDFHAAIVDLIMPGRDGFWLIEHLASARPDLPTIVLTGIHEQEEACRALSLGAWDYLIKPVNSGALGIALTRGLERGRLLELQRRTRAMSAALEERASALLERVDPTCAEVVEAQAARAREQAAGAVDPIARLERVGRALDRLAELATPDSD